MSNTAKQPKPGSEYEKIVAEIHRIFAGDTVVTENEYIIGKRSGKPRQIDVVIRAVVAGYSVTFIVECKDYRRKVGIGEVEEMLGKINDVGATSGILVSNSGFSQDAIDRAVTEGNLSLASVIDIQNKKVRTYLTIPFYYEHLSISGAISLYVINVDGTKYRASEYEIQKFMNFFITDWNEGTAPFDPGGHEYRRELKNKFTNQELGLQFFYTVKQELFHTRVNMVSGKGIYDVGSRTFRSEGFQLERISVLPEEIRRSWKAVPPETISDDRITETIIGFRTVQTIEPIILNGRRTYYPE